MRGLTPGCVCGKGAGDWRRTPGSCSGAAPGTPGGRARPSPPGSPRWNALWRAVSRQRRRRTGRQEGQTASANERSRARADHKSRHAARHRGPSWPPSSRRRRCWRGEQGLLSIRPPPPPSPSVAAAGGDEINGLKSLLLPRFSSGSFARTGDFGLSLRRRPGVGGGLCPVPGALAAAESRSLTGGVGDEHAEEAQGIPEPARFCAGSETPYGTAPAPFQTTILHCSLLSVSPSPASSGTESCARG